MGNLKERLPEWSVYEREIVASPWHAHVDEFVQRLRHDIPAPHWTLAVFDAHRNLIEFYLSESGIDSRTALDVVFAKPLPDVNGASAHATQAQVDHAQFPFQLTAVATTPNKRCAKLVLLRETHDEAFPLSSSRDARAAISTFAQALALRESPDGDETDVTRSRRFPQPALYLLDSSYTMLFMWQPKDIGSIALAQLVEPHDGHLPPFIESTVRRLTRDWNLERPDTCTAGVARPLPGILLRTIPLLSTHSVSIGVLLEPYQTRRSMRTNAAKFRISRRERDVLLLLFDGYSISEIAAKLHLAESTVQDHVKRMIFKTDSHNRIEMAAKLLGWPLSRASEG